MKRMFSLTFVLSLPLLISACETARPIVGPDGSEHLMISCGVIERCYAKASEACGGAYKIVNTSSEVSGANGVTDSTQKLLVKCGK